MPSGALGAAPEAQAAKFFMYINTKVSILREFSGERLQSTESNQLAILSTEIYNC
jgi:hypothetical protein